MTNILQQYQLELLDTLSKAMPSIITLKDEDNYLKLHESTIQIHYSEDKKLWFANGERGNRYVFIFGVMDKPVSEITPEDAGIIIDFDQHRQFTAKSLGMFKYKNSKNHIYLNTDILKNNYPGTDLSEYKKFKFHVKKTGLELKVIDAGSIGEDFIQNIEKLIGEVSKSDNNQFAGEEIDKAKQCSICGGDKTRIKLNTKLHRLNGERPDYCGNCVEKIVVCEFYNKIKPLIKSNQTKDLYIVREKFADDEVYDLGMDLLEKHKILRYVGAKKLFFTIDTKSKILHKYKKLSKSDDLLIDKISGVEKPEISVRKDEITTKTTTLTNATVSKMNILINALKAGKPHEDALTLARLDLDTVEEWYELGKNGDSNYTTFYTQYRPFKPENTIETNQMNLFLKALKHNDFDTALKNTGLNIPQVKSWYNKGMEDDEDYRDFYVKCSELLPDGIPDKSSAELMSEFIALVENGKTNSQAINELEIPEFRLNNWINQAKLGNKDYDDFYNAYMKNTTSNQKQCSVCGRRISEKRKKDICRRCEKKQYASKILLKLLKVTGPETPFKKDDLKTLNLEDFQIKDYIWTLTEFNLIVEKNGKYRLKDEATLKDFIEKSGIEIKSLPKAESDNKLTKTCKKCGKTYPKSSGFFKSETTHDGYEDNCKDCKKLITSAKYLLEIVEIIEYGETFTQDDLKPYIKPAFQIQAKIWALLENDLVRENQDDNTYTLCDEKTAEEFLDQYMDEDYEKPKPKNNTRNQMDRVADVIAEGKSRKEASQITGVPLSKITHWYNEGRQGFGHDNVMFYQKIRDIEKQQMVLKDKMIMVLDDLKNSTQTDATGKGEIESWLEKGEEGTEPYAWFSREYEKIRTTPEIPQIENTNEPGIGLIVKQMNLILKNLAEGMSETESVENSNITWHNYRTWMERGKKKTNGLYNQFYTYVNEIKTEKLSKNRYDGILDPLPEKYEKRFRKHTMNQSGIAWVNKIGNQWVYSKNSKRKQIKISDTDIYSLYLKVKKENQIWGIRDYERAGKIIDIPDDFTIPEKGEVKDKAQTKPDPAIYAPLPPEYANSFSKPTNQTGIAWVNKVGRKFKYSRNVNGKNVTIDDENIYRLYEKVVSENQIWGIRNYDNARKFIDIPEGYEDSIIKQNLSENDIYALLPEQYASEFNKNRWDSGIAGVAKIDEKWIYQRQKNGTPVTIIDSDIRRLHKKVLKSGEIWGVVDLINARKSIEGKAFKSSNVTVTYIEKPKKKTDVLIKGTVENDELIIILNRFKSFENDIRRIVTTSMNSEMDIFIELEINAKSKSELERDLKDLNWQINS